MSVSVGKGEGDGEREGEGEGEEGEGEREGPFISREACRNRYKNGHVQKPELHS